MGLWSHGFFYLQVNTLAIPVDRHKQPCTHGILRIVNSSCQLNTGFTIARIEEWLLVYESFAGLDALTAKDSLHVPAAGWVARLRRRLRRIARCAGNWCSTKASFTARLGIP